VSQTHRQGEPQAIRMSAEIAAPPEAVWRALTEAQELSRWFAIEARVEPGEGGKIWLSWGEPVVAEWEIESWEPGRHLRAIEVRPLGASLEEDGKHEDKDSTRAAEASGGRDLRALDYFIEEGNGNTLLHLVHSGFKESSEFDREFYEAVRQGWEFELLSLRHYLERHYGRPRTTALVRRSWRLPVQSVWEQLLGEKGLGISTRGGEPEVGRSYRLRMATGDELEAVVQLYDPPRHFAATIASLNDALFRIKLVETSTGEVEVNLWEASYGIEAGKVKLFEQRCTNLLDQLFTSISAGSAAMKMQGVEGVEQCGLLASGV
jgi:uncharacterized protein YndB with AHSA1/START domain